MSARNIERKVRATAETPTRALAQQSEVDELREELQHIKQKMETWTVASDAQSTPAKESPRTRKSSRQPETSTHLDRSREADTQSKLGLLGAVRLHASRSSNKESSRVKELEEQLTQAQAGLQRRIDENQLLEQAMKALEHENEKLTKSNEKLNDQLVTACSAFQYYLGNKCMAASIPSIPDGISLDGLVPKMQAFNEQILHAVEPLFETAIRRQESPGINQVAIDYIDKWLGKPITSLLTKESHLGSNTEPNSFVVRVACQVLMANFCSECIDHWDRKVLARTQTEFLQDLYNRVQDDNTENPGAARRWRASARRLTRPDFQDKWYKDAATSVLTCVFEAASLVLPSKLQRRAVKGRLEHLFKTLEDLRIAMKEKIVSVDVQTDGALAGTVFSGDIMDMAYQELHPGGIDSLNSNVERVAGTIGLGLRHVVDGASGGKGNFTFRSFLSPKVVLIRTLLEAPSPFANYDSSQMCGKA